MSILLDQVVQDLFKFLTKPQTKYCLLYLSGSSADCDTINFHGNQTDNTFSHQPATLNTAAITVGVSVVSNVPLIIMCSTGDIGITRSLLRRYECVRRLQDRTKNITVSQLTDTNDKSLLLSTCIMMKCKSSDSTTHASLSRSENLMLLGCFICLFEFFDLLSLTLKFSY